MYNYYGYNYQFAQQGWQCPVCKRCYSPSTFMCFMCPATFTTTPGVVNVPFTQIEYQCSHGKKLGENCPDCAANPQWTLSTTNHAD